MLYSNLFNRLSKREYCKPYFTFSFRVGGIPARNAKGERLLLFLGIIDILQSYRYSREIVSKNEEFDNLTLFYFVHRIVKRLEHGWKSIVHDGVSIVIILSNDNI